MPFATRYTPGEVEPRLERFWSEHGIYHFDVDDDQRPVFSVDTPPPTVSGHLHLGHVYSYSQPDFITRFWRMNDYNVFYPLGYDDNGLPTERLVEQRLGSRAADVGRAAFIATCLEMGVEAGRDYAALWRRMGFGYDWRYTYRTIDEASRRIAQRSFIDLYRNGLAYRHTAPAIWCPECRTAIAQAELHDLERETTFVTLNFTLADGTSLPIATTRPELLPACVAIFVHPTDARYTDHVGHTAMVPLWGQSVPILADDLADPAKGSGAVMCCTFGDTTDVQWWRVHELPLIAAIDRDGRMTSAAGDLAGMLVAEARRAVIARLQQAGSVLDTQTILQSVRVHERCDTPVEYIQAQQWFVRVLDQKQELLALADRIHWHPPHMRARYQHWVENLGWDWCISRQRYFGVPFPVWYCDDCGATILADDAQLPVDPTHTAPACCSRCGSRHLYPEADVMDTWATSSLSPQIVGQWLRTPALYARVFPMSVRPQAHEIIRTWAFYTIVMSYYHFNTIPWQNVMISGWGLAPHGAAKISKSRGGGPVAPWEMINKYSADAVRYWAAGGSLGRDLVISEEQVAAGARLVTKLWNVARFTERFLAEYAVPDQAPELLPTDRWLLSRMHRLIARVTDQFRSYDYTAAKQEIEGFVWTELADNYLELVKVRLYDHLEGTPGQAACYTLHHALLTVIKLFAPIVPYVTEAIYQELFAAREGTPSIHRAAWPTVEHSFISDEADRVGEAVIGIATAVRRYKSERHLSLGTALGRLVVITTNTDLVRLLQAAQLDLQSVTRAATIEVNGTLADDMDLLEPLGDLKLAVYTAA